MLFKSLCLIATALVSSVKADDLPAIEILGNKFFYSNNGSQFYIKGIAYQQDASNVTSDETFVDPLSDISTCERDLPYLTGVATNTLRVYALNASLDHSECMNLFADNGIYIIADLSEPSESINREDPSWTVELYQRYTSIIDEFQNYTNILGFFAGNEVSNDVTNTDASAFVKAAIRDSKQYISDQGYRAIPVGYSANDDATIRVETADYFVCGEVSERADFYGINMYSWCGDSSYTESGYDDRTAEFSNITVPVFFSEYGCNEVQPRKFTEVAALYGENMTGVWSGGIVYMYFEETNNYGLVTISGDTVSTLVDYGYYKTEILAIDPTSVNSDDIASASASATLACPSEDAVWKASTDLPPTPDDALCTCLEDSLSCVISDDVSSDDYEDLFSYVCGTGEITCAGIQSNGTTGEYGAYSFCSSKQKLSFVLNLYYEALGGASAACDFSGSASINTAASTASACSSALSAAGSDGTNTLDGTLTGFTTATSTGTGTSTKTSTSAATASSTGSSSSAGNAGMVSVPVFGSILAAGLLALF